jgi:hypothetical protein
MGNLGIGEKKDPILIRESHVQAFSRRFSCPYLLLFQVKGLPENPRSIRSLE